MAGMGGLHGRAGLHRQVRALCPTLITSGARADFGVGADRVKREFSPTEVQWPQPRMGLSGWGRLPRVAPAPPGQPWALGRNAVGVGMTGSRELNSLHEPKEEFFPPPHRGGNRGPDLTTSSAALHSWLHTLAPYGAMDDFAVRRVDPDSHSNLSCNLR